MDLQLNFSNGTEAADLIKMIKDAANATAKVTALLHEALQEREAANGYICDLLADPIFYEEERARILSEAG